MATKHGQKNHWYKFRRMMNHHGGQRSTEVKNSKPCSMATKLRQKITNDDDTFIEVKGQQRSNVINYVLWLPHLVRCATHVIMTFMEVTNRHKDLLLFFFFFFFCLVLFFHAISAYQMLYLCQLAKINRPMLKLRSKEQHKPKQSQWRMLCHHSEDDKALPFPE